MANNKNGRPTHEDNFIEIVPPTDSLQRICGQETAKRALLISIAGELSICFYGQSGSGKTSLVNALKKIYSKENRRQPPYRVEECDGFPSKELRDIELFAPIEKLSYAEIHKGFIGTSSKDITKLLREKIVQDKFFVAADYWDTIGQVYSKDELNPKIVFTALKVARVIANLEKSEVILKSHVKEAISFVTFPSKRNKHDDVS